MRGELTCNQEAGQLLPSLAAYTPRISLDIRYSLTDDDQPGRVEAVMRLWVYPGGNPFAADAMAGLMRCFLLDARHPRQEPMAEVMEADSDLRPFASLYGAGRAFTRAAAQAGGLEFRERGRLLVLSELGMLPAYRGRGLAALLVGASIEHLCAGGDLVAISPRPLQFVDDDADDESRWPEGLRWRLGLNLLSPDYAESLVKLRGVYRRWGFRTVRGSALMVSSAPRVATALDAITKGES